MSVMFYLSRGGAPEGPFEEAHLLRMIERGELLDGGICPIGQNQWIALKTAPPFAQALATRPAMPAQSGTKPGHGPAPGVSPGYVAAPAPDPLAAPAGHASVPTQLGHGPAPTQPDQVHGPGPTQPDYAAGPTQPDPTPGPTQPDYTPAPTQPLAQASHGAPEGTGPAVRSLPKPLLLGIAAAVVLLLGGAVAAYLLFFASGGAMRVSESMPQDCEFLIEVPSVRKLVGDLRDVQFLDTSLRDEKQLFDNTAASLAKAFDISEADATALLASSETFGLAGRNLASAPEIVIALGMKNAAPVEAFLKSARFAAAGSIGRTGERYRLTRKEVQPGQDALLQGLAEAEVVSAMDTASSDNEVLVWFPEAKLLVVGSSTMVTSMTQVLESGAASIQQSPTFDAAAHDFDRSSRLIAFVEPTFFSTISDPKLKEIINGYFKPEGPITAAMRLEPAGFLTTFTGRISGNKLPRSTAYVAPQALDLPGRLPEETFAYVASSARSGLRGAELQKVLLDQAGLAGPAARAQIEQGVQQLEALLGVSVSKLLDSVGGQTVIGLSATPATSFAGLSATPQSLAQFNLTWILELKEQTEFQHLAAGLRAKVLPTMGEVAVTPDGAGFSLSPRLPAPVTLRVKFLGKYLFVTAGLSTLCDRAEDAFSKGERTLKDEPGHQRARGAVAEKQHFLLWIDTGRIGDTLMQNSVLRAQLLDAGLSLDKVHMSGADRITSALSLRAEVAGETWTYHVDALNLQAFVPLTALGSALRVGMRSAVEPE